MTRIADVWVAFEATELSTVELASAASDAIDLARHLRLPAPALDRRRLARRRHLPNALLLGDTVTFVEVPADAMHDVPAFVAGHLRALAIERLVTLDEGFAYLVSPSRLRGS
jgi:hypothetical protein